MASTIAYPPSMAKPPWARFTKPIKPMVTESPTETMNRIMPAAMPPRSMLATSTPRISGGSLGRAGPDLLLLAGVLDRVDLADDLLEHAAVLHHRFRQVLVHDDVARGGVDRDGTARARVLPALDRLERLLDVDLPLERLDHVDDQSHAIVATDGHEVGHGLRAVRFLPGGHEPLV